jgi:SAM-dependent methyltransferase
MQRLTEPDPFADALESFYLTGRGSFTFTRSDGRRDVEDAANYFASYKDLPLFEKQALRFARGRALDVGCGAGRHALYLQRKGFRVTAIDSSPRVAALASARGVRDVHVASACERLPFKRAEFETVLLFGNNLGICASRAGAGRMLKELARVTSPNARLLATSRAPGTFDPKHRTYWNRQLMKGKEFGVAHFCLEFKGENKKEVSLLLLAPSELMDLAWQWKWQVQEIFGDGNSESGYAAVLVKR